VTRAALLPLCLFLLSASCASYDPLSLETRSFDERLASGGTGSGIRVAHISDLHARLYGSLYAELVRRLRALDPDLLLITGDLVTSQADYRVLERLMDAIGSRAPIYAVRGNWDLSVDSDPGRLRGALGRAGGRLLVNETESILAGGRRIVIYGADDLLAGGFEPPEAARLKAAAGEAEFPLYLILCHEPAFVDRLDSDMLGLRGAFAFSGHTHGGQVTFFGLPFPRTLPELSGRYLSGEYDLGDLRLFVSRGVGTSRIDFRLFARPDIMVYEL
jgi:predicted MPP superfamily phosphohydrolase